MPHPNIVAYVADKKYAEVADFVGLRGANTSEKVDALIDAVSELLSKCELPMTIKELGISEKDFRKALPELVDKAFDDPSSRSNPRFPMEEEIEDLFLRAYAGDLKK
jgi:acetaldehyde dehydrogenase/alcohol dehydrogenase